MKYYNKATRLTGRLNRKRDAKNGSIKDSESESEEEGIKKVWGTKTIAQGLLGQRRCETKVGIAQTG